MSTPEPSPHGTTAWWKPASIGAIITSIGAIIAAIIISNGGSESQRLPPPAPPVAVPDVVDNRLERQQQEPRQKSARQPGVTVTVIQPATSQREPASSPGGSSTRPDDWPDGSGYTTILASVATEAKARRIQATASGRGLDAGVLYSTNHRSLRPGYWVVFSGTNSSKQDADRHTARAKSLGYGDAYPRFVSE